MVAEMQSRSFLACVRAYPGCLAYGGMDVQVDAVTYDSRSVRPGMVFVCVPGFVEDGTRFWEEARVQGAAAFVVETQEARMALEKQGVPWALVESAREALAYFSQLFMDWPAQTLRVQACFGASGRESLARLLQTWFQSVTGRAACLYGMQQVFGDLCYYGGRTVPQALEWAKGLAAAKQAGMDWVFVPIAEAALELHRAAWMDWDTVYLLPGAPDPNCKAFRDSLLKARRAVVCVEDAVGRSWYQLFRDRNIPCLRVGRSEEADVQITASASQEQAAFLGQQVRCRFETQQGVHEQVWDLQVPGPFHPLNLAMGWARLLMEENADLDRAAQGLTDLILPGHTEPVVTGSGKRLVLDAAWRPEPLRALLRGLRPWVQPGGRLLLLFGSGGERPREQRLELGRVCAEEADGVILTVSHPRSEGSEGIVAQLEEGFLQVENRPVCRCIPDRKQAILALLEESTPQDLCILAGRGEEGYLIDAKSLEFGSDASVLEQIDGPLKIRAKLSHHPNAWTESRDWALHTKGID